jgi:hypothetical protein
MFNGTNNGAIFLSVRDATARLGFADYKAAMAAFAELEQLGFITETMASGFSMKADTISRARAWRLNWIGRDGRCGDQAALPPLDFGTLSKIQKRRVASRSNALTRYLGNYSEGKFAVEESTTLGIRRDAAGAASVGESTTLTNNNGEKPPISSVGESTTYIEIPLGSGDHDSHSERVAARRARLRLAVIAPAANIDRSSVAA